MAYDFTFTMFAAVFSHFNAYLSIAHCSELDKHHSSSGKSVCADCNPVILRCMRTEG